MGWTCAATNPNRHGTKNWFRIRKPWSAGIGRQSAIASGNWCTDPPVGIWRFEGQVVTETKPSIPAPSFVSWSTESKDLSTSLQFVLPSRDNPWIEADSPRVGEAAHPISISKGISITPRKCVRKRIRVIHQSLGLNSIESIQARTYPPQEQNDFVRYLLIRAHRLTVLSIHVARHVSN